MTTGDGDGSGGLGAWEAVEVPAAMDGERVDRLVAMVTGCSRSEAAEAVAAGGVRLDGEVVLTRSTRVGVGALLELAVDPRRQPPRPVAEPDVEIAVVHEDDSVIVVDKAAGLVVHPGAGHEHGTLVSGLLARFPEIGEVGEAHRPGIVHRLDKGTSGLLVVARTQFAYVHLVDLLSRHEVERGYESLVWGRVEAERGTIDAPVGRSRRDPQRMTVAADGRDARTHYEVVHRWAEPEVTRLAIHLETGRTHQIRVHLSSIGHPVVGDPVYGARRDPFGLGRPFLHAARLAFVHPEHERLVEFTSPLASDLRSVALELEDRPSS